MPQEASGQQVRDISIKDRVNQVALLAVFFIALADTVQPTRAQTFTTLYQFAAQSPTDGNSAFGGLLDYNSVLYGMTFGGEPSGTGPGTIFQFDLNSDTETVLHHFSSVPMRNRTDGAQPIGSLILSGSTLYGMTQTGGASSSNAGTIIQYSLTSNTESVLHSFNGSDGGLPYGNLTQSGSILYGMTSHGGVGGRGNIFQYDINSGVETSFYNFAGGTADGNYPQGSLTLSGSNLYGMTPEGGANSDGVIFQYSLTTGKESIIHSFAGGSNDGAIPDGSLTQYGSMLYGLTQDGGQYNMGTLFQVDPSTGQLTVLHSFGSPGDGTYPTADLLLSGSTLYGSTDSGGSAGSGTVFQFDLGTHTETLLHQFDGYAFLNPNSPNIPEGDLTLSGSTLYGMTPSSIFEIQLPEPTSLMTLTLATILIARRRSRSSVPLKSA